MYAECAEYVVRASSPVSCWPATKPPKIVDEGVGMVQIFVPVDHDGDTMMPGIKEYSRRQRVLLHLFLVSSTSLLCVRTSSSIGTDHQ